MTLSIRDPSAASRAAALDAWTDDLDHPDPCPTEAELTHVGSAVMSEVLDLLLGSALEDFAPALCESLIGGLHAGVLRLEQQGDRARDDLAVQLRGFDGGEAADVELQASRRRADAADLAAAAMALVRDAAASAYAAATGEVWSPWRAAARPVRATAAVIEAQAAIKAARARRQDAHRIEGPVVAFRGAPAAETAQDASRIFDALNWAQAEWPGMTLALTGAPGAERLARRWAAQKRVDLVLARPDFRRHGRAAPFRANAELMALEPVCVIALASSLCAEEPRPFGPALNLLQQAQERGVRAIRIRPRSR